MNILIQPVSTLRAEKPEKMFHLYEGEQCFFAGVSSLEAASKNLMTQLAAAGETLDLILLLGTKETKDKMDIEAIRYYGKCSSEELYIKRIKAFAQNQAEQEEIRKTILEKYAKVPEEKKKEKEEAQLQPLIFCLRDIYPEITYGDKPDIPDLEAYSDSKSAVAQLISTMMTKAEGYAPAQIKVYVDTQGGQRALTFVLTMALEMLRIKGIQAAEYYYTAFNSQKLYHPIHQVTEEYRLLDLASAFDDFVQYARGNRLADCYKIGSGFKRKKEEADTPNIIWTIIQVSKAISLCDTANMQAEMITLIGQLTRHKAGGDPLFDLFVGDLQHSYVGILDGQGQIRTVALIRWCIQRHLLQQALTLVYERMPDEFVRAGIISFSGPQQSLQEYKTLVSRIIAKAEEKCDRGLYNDMRRAPNHRMFQNIKSVLALQQETGNGYWRLNATMTPFLGDLVPALYTKAKDVDSIQSLLQGYICLKRYRNKVNHSNPVLTGYDAIKEELLAYLAAFEKVASAIAIQPRSQAACLPVQKSNYLCKTTSKPAAILSPASATITADTWNKQTFQQEKSTFYARHGILYFWTNVSEKADIEKQLQAIADDPATETHEKETILSQPVAYLLHKARKTLCTPQKPDISLPANGISRIGNQVETETNHHSLRYQAYTRLNRDAQEQLHKSLNHYYSYYQRDCLGPGDGKGIQSRDEAERKWAIATAVNLDITLALSPNAVVGAQQATL